MNVFNYYIKKLIKNYTHSFDFLIPLLNDILDCLCFYFY